MTQQNEFPTNSSTPQTTFSPTESMLLSLRQTKPWARLLSVLGFISIGFMVIVGMVNIFVFPKVTGGSSFVPGILMVSINILMGLLHFFPSLFLFKFASSISRLLDGGGIKEMEEALLNQKSFWKFVGILILVMFSIAILGIVAAIIIPQIMVK